MFLMSKPIPKPVPQSVVGTYPTAEAAARQVELVLLNSDSEPCCNIVQTEKGYTVQTVCWQ